MTIEIFVPADLSGVVTKKSVVNTQIDDRPASQASAHGSVALAEKTKSLYQVDHQVELLHLHADVECLLQQLQALKQQRQTSC